MSGQKYLCFHQYYLLLHYGCAGQWHVLIVEIRPRRICSGVLNVKSVIKQRPLKIHFNMKIAVIGAGAMGGAVASDYVPPDVIIKLRCQTLRPVL